MPRLMFSAVLTFAVAAAVAGADGPAEEAKKLHGEWQAVEVQVKGKTAAKGDAELKDIRLIIDGDGITLPSPVGDGKDRKKTFKLNPAKSPKEIDITSLDGQEKDQTAACIYKLEKDRLTICIPYFTQDPTVRPKEFKSGAEDGMMLITLERVKAK